MKISKRLLQERKKIIDIANSNKINYEEVIKTDEEINGIKIRKYQSHNFTKNLLFYFHGGGFCSGSIETHDSSCQILSKSTNFIVISIDYSLAPEKKFPVPFSEAKEIINLLISQYSDYSFFIAGDSAGGTIAACMCSHFPLFKKQVLIYPMLSIEIETLSKQIYNDYFYLTQSLLDLYKVNFFNNKNDYSNELVNPLNHIKYENIPDTLIICAGMDPLKDEAKLYANRLSANNIKVNYLVFERQMHGFMLLNKTSIDSELAYDICSNFLLKSKTEQ